MGFGKYLKAAFVNHWNLLTFLGSAAFVTILGPVDFLLLDGAKPLYQRVLKLVEPHLRKGALVAADNINPRNKIEDFTGYVREPKNGYVSVDMPLGDGIEVSMRV